jgi:hypothetical protein
MRPAACNINAFAVLDKVSMKLILNLVLAALASVALAACGEGRTRPPQVPVTVINAAPGYSAIAFVRARRTEGTLPYKGTKRLIFDSDTYNFTVAIVPADSGSLVDVETFSQTLVPDNEYIYVVTQATPSAPEAETLLISHPTSSVADSNVEFSFVHASGAQPDVDVYFEAPGTVIANAVPIGTVGFRSDIAPTTAAAGDFAITLTEAGNPANVLMTSPTFALPGGTSTIFVLVDGANEGTFPMSIVAVGDATADFIDVNAQSAVRLINGAVDRAARDLYLNDDFSAPLLADVAFGAATAFTPLAPAANKLTLTPAGNVGVIEAESTDTYLPGIAYSIVFSGNGGTLDAISAPEDFRVIFDKARIRAINLVNHVEGVAIFIGAEGTGLGNPFPYFELSAPGISDRATLALGRYEFVIRDAATGAVLFGPELFDMTRPGIYTLAAVDNADGATADVVLVDAPQ